MKNRLQRLLRYVALGGVLGYLTYLALANAFLNLGGVEKALESTDDIQASIGSGYTLWPGSFYLSDARIVFHDHNLEWSLDAKRLELQLALVPFFSKTFRATSLRGDGLVFRTRQRVHPDDAELATTKALPPIPEFETPALIYPQALGAPRSDLWRIHIEGVDVGVEELWVEQFRYIGSGRARGAFRLHAGFHLWVGPATLDLDPGELRVGGELLSASVGGHFETRVHPFFVHDVEGNDLFRQFSVGVELSVLALDFEPLDLLLPSGTAARSDGGRLTADVDLKRGTIQPASFVQLRAPAFDLSHDGLQFGSRVAEVRASAAAEDQGLVSLRVEHLRAQRSTDTKAQLELAEGSVSLGTSGLDLTGSFALESIEAAVSKLDVPELSALDEYTKAHGLRLRGGGARFDGSGRYANDIVNGELRARVSNARGSAGGVGWEAHGNARVALGRLQTETLSEGTVDVSFQGSRLVTFTDGLRLEAGDATVSARATLSEQRSHGRVTAKVRRLSLRQGALRATGRADLDVVFSKLDVDRNTAHGQASGTLEGLVMSSGPDLRGQASKLTLRSEFALDRGVLSRGWFDAAIPTMSFRSGDTAVSSAVQFRAEAKDLDLHRGKGSASSLALLRNVSVVDATRTTCQSAQAPHATLRTKLQFDPEGRPNMEVSGNFQRARARWDDFDMSGDVKFEARQSGGTTRTLSLDVDATRLHLQSGSNDSEGWEASIPKLRVGALLRGQSHSMRGPVRVHAERINGRIGKTVVRAGLGLNWKFSEVDLERSMARGSGNASIDRLAIDAGDDSVKDWWGRVELPVIELGVSQNVDVSGQFDAKFRDALPALSLFASTGDLPGWIPDLIPLEQLEARGQFRRKCRVTDLVIQSARGGPLAAAGHFQSVPNDTRGAVLIQLPSFLRLSVGLVTHADELGVAIFAGNDWLGEQSKILNRWSKAAQSCGPAPESCKPAQRSEMPD